MSFRQGQGFPNQEADLLIGVVAPAGTPKAIVELLQKNIANTVDLPDAKQRLNTLGFTPVASTPETYAMQIKDDIVIWGKVVHELGIHVE